MQYIQYVSQNALDVNDWSKFSSKQIFDKKVDLWLSVAWREINGDKDILNLYSYLRVKLDRDGKIFDINPMSYEFQEKLGITSLHNISLAILEICLYLDGYLKDSDNKLPDYNTFFLAIKCSELFNELLSSRIKSDELVIKNDLVSARKYLKKAVKTRTNDLKSNIIELIRMGTPKTVPDMWRELEKYCGVPGHCVTAAKNDKNGERVIMYRDKGKEKILTRARLKERMRKIEIN